MANRIFISLQLQEASREAHLLKSHFEAQGISVFFCDIPQELEVATPSKGKLYATQIRDSLVKNAIDGCELVIILGTQLYGKSTAFGYSTLDELCFIKKKEKPFLFIKMCDRFVVCGKSNYHILEEFESRCHSDESLLIKWTLNTPVPRELVACAIQKLNFLCSVSSSSSVPVDSIHEVNLSICVCMCVFSLYIYPQEKNRILKL